jgi:hypothetical protein
MSPSPRIIERDWFSVRDLQKRATSLFAVRVCTKPTSTECAGRCHGWRIRWILSLLLTLSAAFTDKCLAECIGCVPGGTTSHDGVDFGAVSDNPGSVIQYPWTLDNFSENTSDPTFGFLVHCYTAVLPGGGLPDAGLVSDPVTRDVSSESGGDPDGSFDGGQPEAPSEYVPDRLRQLQAIFYPPTTSGMSGAGGTGVNAPLPYVSLPGPIVPRVELMDRLLLDNVEVPQPPCLSGLFRPPRGSSLVLPEPPSRNAGA